jgi:hypothetical protein
LQKDIKKDRCIVMLGPRISGVQQNGKWSPLIEEFSAAIARQLEKQGLPFESAESNNLSYIAQQFLRAEKNRRVDLGDLAQDFYSEHVETPPLYREIAKMPVSIFVNTTPDNFIAQALREAGKNPVVYSYNFYRRTEAEPLSGRFTPDEPLVFNLLGNVGHPESLVLSEFDQVDFIRSVVRDDPPIPKEILSQFDENKTYIFLGFNMENWQFRLLLDSLKLVEENITVSPQTDNYPLRSVTQSYYEARYRFHFEDQRIADFVNQIMESLKEGEEEKKRFKLFIGYTDEDVEYAKDLEKHLGPLEKNGQVTIWHKEMILHGDVDQQVRAQIEEANVILLLLSPDFLDKDETYDRELAMAIEAQKEGKAVALPVIARACVWRANDNLRRMKPVPTNGLPINSNNWESPETAYSRIVEELKERLGIK